MATIFNSQRVLGVRLQADGATLFNNQPVRGVRAAANGVTFDGGWRVLGVDVLDADAPIHNDQPVIGVVVISDGRTIYNGREVLPAWAVTGDLGGGGSPADGELVAARVLNDGWTVELDFHNLPIGAVDPTKLTSVALTYPAVDAVGTANISPPSIAGVASHASLWWDSDNVFPTPSIAGSTLTVPVRVNKPIRGDDTGTVTVAAGIVAGALAGSIALDCTASMLIHLAAVEANPDPLSGLTARVEHPFGCRIPHADLTTISTASPPTGWAYTSAGGGYFYTTADDATLVGYDTNGYHLDIRHKRVKIHDNYVRRNYTAIFVAGVIGVNQTGAGGVFADGAEVFWNDIDGGWGPETNSSGARGVYERVSGTNIFNNKFHYNHLWGTQDDSGRISGGGSGALGNYTECGGWAIRDIAEGSQPHYDAWELNYSATGSTAALYSKYNFTSFYVSDAVGTYARYGRTSATAPWNCVNGAAIYRNVFGFGATSVSARPDTQFYIGHSLDPNGTALVQYDENFFDEPGLNYMHPTGPYGLTSFTNNRRLRASSIGGSFAAGSVIADMTAKRRRTLGGAYRASGTGNQRVYGT